MLINKFFISSLQEFKYYLKLKTSKIVKTCCCCFFQLKIKLIWAKYLTFLYFIVENY